MAVESPLQYELVIYIHTPEKCLCLIVKKKISKLVFARECSQRKNLWMGLRFLLTTDRQKLARDLPHVAAGRRCRGANIQLQFPPFSKCMVPKPEAEPGEQTPTITGRATCQHCAQSTATMSSMCVPFACRESALCLNNSFLLFFSFWSFQLVTGKWGGERSGQPAKMKLFMKRKLLKRQIVLSGWVLCSWLCVAREGTVQTVFWLTHSCFSKEITVSPAAAQKLWVYVILFPLPPKVSVYCWWHFCLARIMFTL